MDGKIISIDGDGSKIDTNNNLDDVKSVYVKYLSGLHSPDNPWVMGQFEVGDGTLIRGLRATRDIQANELVFRDRALVIGPRCNNYEHIFCVVCFKTMSSLVMCPFGCRLPVCDNSCSDSDRHRPECELIRRWKYVDPLKKYSRVCFRSLPQIRGLLLPKDEKTVVAAMAANLTKQVSAEAEGITKEFQNVPRETVDELKLIIAALNTNAFETITTDQTSLRGLFPLAAAMNHNCVPNGESEN
jgi:SET domain